MYIGEGQTDDSFTQIKRYSVVGNDPSFKSYTKNPAFYDAQQNNDNEAIKQSVLTVALKDLEDTHELKKTKSNEIAEGL